MKGVATRLYGVPCASARAGFLHIMLKYFVKGGWRDSLYPVRLRKSSELLSFRILAAQLLWLDALNTIMAIEIDARGEAIARPATPKLESFRQWLAPSLIIGLLLVLYAGVLKELVHAWMNETGASHGILIPPLAFYIAWMRRDLTLKLPVVPDGNGLWMSALGCVLYLVGRLGAEFFLERISLLVLLTGLIWTFWGSARLKTLLFPLVLLVTMIPIPQLIYGTVAAPLQLFASRVSTDFAQLLGVSVYRDGNVIHLSQTTLGVEEACSGLHSLSALMVGSLLLGFLNYSRVSLRLVLFLSSIPIAIAANVLRVTGTALLADYRAEFAMGFYHSFSGWLIFLVGFGLLLGFMKILQILFRDNVNP